MHNVGAGKCLDEFWRVNGKVALLLGKKGGVGQI